MSQYFFFPAKFQVANFSNFFLEFRGMTIVVSKYKNMGKKTFKETEQLANDSSNIAI